MGFVHLPAVTMIGNIKLHKVLLILKSLTRHTTLCIVTGMSPVMSLKKFTSTSVSIGYRKMDNLKVSCFALLFLKVCLATFLF